MVATKGGPLKAMRLQGMVTLRPELPGNGRIAEEEESVPTRLILSLVRFSTLTKILPSTRRSPNWNGELFELEGHCISHFYWNTK